jgi:hypothetical protein
MDYHQKQCKHIWLMSTEDTFIYSQWCQLLNKLNNLRHAILSLTIIRKNIYLCIMCQEFYLFVIMTTYLFPYNMQMCVMAYDALPLGLLICHPCDCYIHTPIACSPYTQSSVKSIRKCKQSLYNQPKPYVFKKYCEVISG